MILLYISAPMIVTLVPGLLPFGGEEWDPDWTTWIPCYITDVDHDRLVTVTTSQSHGGTDLGLWQMQYPGTSSMSVVNFAGEGKIDPEDEKAMLHDSSIIRVN